MTIKVWFYILSISGVFANVSEPRWIAKAVPNNSISFLNSLMGDPPDSLSNDGDIVRLAGVWEIATSSEVNAIKTKFGIDSSPTLSVAFSWPDMLKFMGSGQSPAVYRFLERREPVQEVYFAGDGCIQDDSCNPTVNTTVWFTPKELRGTQMTLNEQSTYSSQETGTHQVVTNYLSVGSTGGLIQASINTKKKQTHEHLRVVFPSIPGVPDIMLYRWVVIKGQQEGMELTRWYHRSKLVAYPSRELFPIDPQFTTQPALLASKYYPGPSSVNAVPDSQAKVTKTESPSLEVSLVEPTPSKLASIYPQEKIKIESNKATPSSEVESLQEFLYGSGISEVLNEGSLPSEFLATTSPTTISDNNSTIAQQGSTQTVIESNSDKILTPETTDVQDSSSIITDLTSGLVPQLMINESGDPYLSRYLPGLLHPFMARVHPVHNIINNIHERNEEFKNKVRNNLQNVW